MKITKVTYRALFNLGNYENETIEFETRLEENETPEEAIARLRDRAVACAGSNVEENESKRRKLQVEVAGLERKMKETQKQWVEITDFLKAQGIKTDPVSFPSFSKLLKPAVESVDSEFVDNDGF